MVIVTTPSRDQLRPDESALETDILVRGSGAAASLLAAALARGGRSVVLLREARGSRRTSDLSTIPYGAELALLIADRFNLPEVASLALFERVPPALARASGEKTNLGFCHHRTGRSHEPAEALQLQVPGEHAEWQPDRAALERWAAGVARAHGAIVLDGDAQELEADADGVRAVGANGHVIGARVFVDAVAGAPADGDRERARVLSADLTGVEPFERVLGGRRHGDVRSWSAGTLTHTFAGGYLQVCHHGSRRPTGVTLVLAGQSADHDLDAAAQVAAALAELPDLRAQLAHAQPVVGWEDSWAQAHGPVATGDRVLTLDVGAGREPLLGRELTLGLEAVLAAGAALLDAGEGAERAALEAARERIAALTEHEDRHALALLASAHDFGLVNALLRIWLLESIVRALALKRGRLDAAAAGDFSALDRGAGAFWFRIPRGLRGLVEASLSDAEAAGRSELPPSAAARRIFDRLRRSRITPPLFDFGDPEARVYRFTTARRLRMLVWVTLRAPADFRGLLTQENVSAGRPRG